MDFAAVLGDLIGSRKIPGRKSVSKNIASALRKIQSEFREQMTAPLKLTQGMDEISGLFKNPNAAFRASWTLNNHIYPHQFRIAISLGKIDIGLSSKDAGQMDGPAFHQASKLIEVAKLEKKYYIIDLGSSEELKNYSKLITETANLIVIISNARSKHQREIVMEYDKLLNQKKVAKKLSITQQAVSDALRKANWKETNEAERVINRILESV
jgi:hypothetical protein